MLNVVKIVGRVGMNVGRARWGEFGINYGAGWLGRVGFGRIDCHLSKCILAYAHVRIYTSVCLCIHPLMPPHHPLTHSHRHLMFPCRPFLTASLAPLILYCCSCCLQLFWSLQHSPDCWQPPWPLQ